MAYVIGHISGRHLNPAMFVGVWAGGRFPASQLAPLWLFWVTPIAGALPGAGIYRLIGRAED